MRRAAALTALLLMTTACAGDDGPQLAGPPRDPGHGSVEEVVKVLEEQGVPCNGAEPVALPEGIEQAVTCTLDLTQERVLLVHFFDEAGAAAFEEQTRAAGQRGVYAATWAARPETERGADVIARAVQNRGRS